jgi:2-dehydropantoate 2-reductase
MRYVVLGAGGVGGTIGGRLADAGHEVVLLARGDHARVMRREGLRLATPHRVIVVRPEIVDRPADLRLRPDDVLVVATKTQDTEALVAEVARLPVEGFGGSPAGASLPVVCAQNGVENERIALRQFRRVIGMCVMLPAVFLEPGRVDAQGTPVSGILEIGRYPDGIDDATSQFADVLNGCGFKATARADIMRWKYAKLLANLGNAVQALSGVDLSPAEQRISTEINEQARGEAERCLNAAGIPYVPDDDWTANREGVMSIGPVEGRSRTGGSSWQSVQRGAGSIETDALNGEIVLIGRTIGEATPVNEILQQQANALLLRGDPPGGVTPQALQRLIERMT